MVLIYIGMVWNCGIVCGIVFCCFWIAIVWI